MTDTRVVHLGSGSGSLLTCVLSEDSLDFERLLAILESHKRGRTA